MKVHPLSNKVMLQLIKTADKTPSGIMMPTHIDKERQGEGEVVAVGPGRILEDGSHAKVEVDIGNRVLFNKWASDVVSVDGEEYTIISMDKIFCVIS